MNAPSPLNPYVGPRPFLRNESERFFGRDREGRELLSLVISTPERLVLFYAQSGAGKSSLINTRLIPGLEKKNFEVLPVGRVSGDLLNIQQTTNIFASNLMISLDQSGHDPRRFAGLRLTEFLLDLTTDGERFYWAGAASGMPVPAAASGALKPASAVPASGDHADEIWPRALVIDQFEEIFTTHLEAWEQRGDFFKQLGEALNADPYLWVVLVIREDYIAGLDPFAHLLPGNLRARYLMQRMDYEAALAAVKEPASMAGRKFTEEAAEKLVNNLRLISTGQGGSQPGQFVEPVQLQVVCWQLWESLKDRPGPEITDADLQELARGGSLAQFINRALGDFYEQALARVLSDPNSSTNERDLRKWFSSQLITEAGTRGFVYQGKASTGGLPNEAVRLLERQFIIRSETKAGGKWYELAHDRFVSPILEANRRWSQAHARPVTAAAEAWNASGKLQEKLYSGLLLRSALAELNKEPEDFSELEREFLQTSKAKSDKRAMRRRQISLGLTLLVITILAATTTFAVFQWFEARRNTENAKIVGNNLAARLATREQELVEAQNQVTHQVSTLVAVVGIPLSIPIGEPPTTAIAMGPATNAEAAPGGQTGGIPITPTITPTPVPSAVEGTEQGPLPGPDETEQPGEPEPSEAANEPTFTPTPTPAPTSTPIPTEPPTMSALEALRLQFSYSRMTQTAFEAQPVQQVSVGLSVKGVVITATQIGFGANPILLIGGQHAGFAPSTVELARQTIDYFSRHPDEIPSDISLYVIENANPDSPLAAGQLDGRLNARGVDLNRNWDCEWTADARWGRRSVSGGSAPFSEPETQSLSDYILKLSPAAVVFWEAQSPNGMVAPGGCGVQSLFSTSLAETYGKGARYNVAEFDAYAVTGDATNWLDLQGIPAVSVLLRDYVEVTDWEQHHQAILALFRTYTSLRQ